MTYICKNCYEEFNTPSKTSSRMGLAWIIFIFFSMGIGLIFWLFMRGKAKEICPHCKSENFVRTDSRAGMVILSQIGESSIKKEIEVPINAEAKTEEDNNDTKVGMFVIAAVVLFIIIIANINN